MDVKQVKFQQERLKILLDIYCAEKQLTAGKGIAQKTAKTRVLKTLKRTA